MASLWDQDLPGFRARRLEPAVRDQAGLRDIPSWPRVEPVGGRECGKGAEPQWPDKPALHRGHDAHGHGESRHVGQSGDTIATPGVSGPSVDRQPQPGPDTQSDRVQQAAVRAIPRDWRDAVSEGARRGWQPKVALADAELAVVPESGGAEING